MIVGLILKLVSAILDGFVSLLPIGSLALPAASNLADLIGEHAGPIDSLIPLHESVEFMVIMLTVWLPAIVTYTLITWGYKHLPVFGKG